MAENTHIKFLRGTTAENDLYTGLDGEITVDSDKKLLRLHDGVTPGGKALDPSTGAPVQRVNGLTGDVVIPAATETARGTVEKATIAEAKSGMVDKFPDAAGVMAAINESTASGQIGWNQTWQNVTSSRSFGVTYTNYTGRPIFVTIDITWDHNGYVIIDGTYVKNYYVKAYSYTSFGFIVPHSHTYRVTGTGGLVRWAELR